MEAEQQAVAAVAPSEADAGPSAADVGPSAEEDEQQPAGEGAVQPAAAAVDAEQSVTAGAERAEVVEDLRAMVVGPGMDVGPETEMEPMEDETSPCMLKTS